MTVWRKETLFIGNVGKLFHIVALVPLSISLSAQDAAPVRTAFEVVSVKPSGTVDSYIAADGRSYLNTKPFRYTDQTVIAVQSLSDIIRQAYSLNDWELDSPSWTHQLTYEISARMPAGTNRSTARVMLQTMLAERFGLQFHRQARKIQVYALFEGKHGFSLSEAPASEERSTQMGQGRFRSVGSLENMVYVFLNYSDRPLVDDTDLHRTYHIELSWTPDDPANHSRHFDAEFWRQLERQTGLKIEKREVTRDILVVDRAERQPTAN
jgi:uncharacterized protein (TIGR03435 family)